MKTYERRRPSLKRAQKQTDLAGLCRLCLCISDGTRSVFDSIDGVPLPIKINACISIEVHEGDGLPTEICLNCITQLEGFYKFRKRCEEADIKLRNITKEYNDIQIPESQQNMECEAHTSSFSSNNTVYLTETSIMSEALAVNNTDIDTVTHITTTDSLEKGINSIIVVSICESPVQCSSNLIIEGNNECSENGVNESTQNHMKENTFPNVCLNEKCLRHMNCTNSMKSSWQINTNSNCQSETLFTIESTEANTLHMNNQNISDKHEHSTPDTVDNIANVSKTQKMSNMYLFMCEKCPKGFSKRIDLKRHSSVHDQERGFVCGVCEKWFPSKTSFKRHERIHTGERPFQCTYCEKCFSQDSILARHLMIHKGEKPFKCEECGKGFTQRVGLKFHVQRHANQALQQHSCPLCDKVFCHQSGLSRHLISHTGKTFDCQVCLKSFSDQSSLKRHSKRHVTTLEN